MRPFFNTHFCLNQFAGHGYSDWKPYYNATDAVAGESFHNMKIPRSRAQFRSMCFAPSGSIASICQSRIYSTIVIGPRLLHKSLGTNYTRRSSHLRLSLLHSYFCFPDVIHLAEQLEWEQYSLLSHSFGSGVAQCVSAVVPDRCGDGFCPRRHQLSLSHPLVSHSTFHTLFVRHDTDPKLVCLERLPLSSDAALDKNGFIKLSLFL
jgi:hypothetical protein